MPTLQRRVQVLFDPDKYSALESLARSQKRSVGSVVREAVDDRLQRLTKDRMAAFERLLASARSEEGVEEDWETIKASFESRPYLGAWADETPPA